MYMAKIKARECQNVEYKTSWHDEYLKWICGFANAQGAVMYFGVNDDHEVVGIENVDRLMEDIPNKIVNFMGLVVAGAEFNYEWWDIDYIRGDEMKWSALREDADTGSRFKTTFTWKRVLY